MSKRLFYTLFWSFLSLVSHAQTDTSESIDSLETYEGKNFSTYSSSLQFSLGKNLTVGDYGGKKTPFTDGFAFTDDVYQISVNAKYTQKIKNNYGFEVGAEYLRNPFDWQSFDKAYLKTFGDSMGSDRFFYKHLSVFAGGNYNLVYKRLMVSASMGTGIIYNLPIRGGGEVALKTNPRNIENFKGGTLEIINGFMPLLYSGLNTKYFLGDEFYVVANSHFTYSLYKIRVVEAINSREEREYLNKSLALNNISLSLGVGTLF